MHISDGLLPAPVVIGGYAITGLTTWYSLRQINHQPQPTRGIPKASLLTAAFFVASSIHIPFPPTSLHLILNGLLGVVLGYYAFPAILIGLFFQAVMLGHGGISTLGINAVIVGIPALLIYHLFCWRSFIERYFNKRVTTGIFAFLAGALGVALTVILFFGLVVTTFGTGEYADSDVFGYAPWAYRAATFGLVLAHIPLMILEGIFTSFVVLFLQQVKPQLLEHNG